MTTPRPPRQPRSQASLARIVDAARELLEFSGFDELTVAELARRARSSVGVFYSRFRDKRALLELLAERYAEEAHRAVQRFGAERAERRDDAGRRTAGAPDPAGEVRAVVRFVVRFHRERAGLVRALLLEARARPRGRVAQRLRTMKTLPPTIERLLSAHPPRAGHPPPRAAIAGGFFLVVAGAREWVLFGAGREAAGDEEELVRLLAAAWLGVLGAAGHRGHLYS